MRTLLALLCLLLASALIGCVASPAHGKLSAHSLATTHDWKACRHGVPDSVCVQCHPDRAQAYKDRGDWCPEHSVPESQCLKCHPDLDFSPPKAPPKGADVSEIVKAGEALPALEPHVVPGRITIFDFYAAWCTACRKLDTYLYARIAQGLPVSIRKINIVDWDSKVSEKWLAEVPELPYVIIYGKRGQKVRAFSGTEFGPLEEALAEAAR